MIYINDLCCQFALVSPTGEQYDCLLRQLRDRMEEGCGETMYVVGMGTGETDCVDVTGIVFFRFMF